jgi:hypothetical protein
MSFPFDRVLVIGASASGKSTLAQRLSDTFSLTLIDLDEVFWRPNWQKPTDEQFRQEVDLLVTSNARWVVAGNYKAVRDLVWPRAQLIVWLDLPFWTTLWRLTVRTLRRWWYREELFGKGLRESLWSHCKFWSEDSLYYWHFVHFISRRRAFEELFRSPAFVAHTILRFRSQMELDEWLRHF